MSSIRGIISDFLFPSVPSKVKSLILILSINNLSMSYFMVMLTGYLPEIGVGSAVVGLVIGIEGIVLVLAGIPLGILSDRRGRRWILILTSAGIAPILFTFALTSNIILYIIAAIIGGFAESGFLSTVNALIADQTRPEERDSSFSLSFILGTVFFGIGAAIPFFFPFLEGLAGMSSKELHQGLLLIFGFVTIVTPVLLWRLLRDYRENQVSKSINTIVNIEDKKGLSLFPRSSNIRTLFKFSGINSLIGLGAGFIIPLVPTWLYLKFGVPDTYSGPLLALSSITMAFAAVMSPRLSKRFGPIKAIAVNESLSTIFMFSLAFIGDPLLAAFFYIIRASLMNMATPLADSLLMSLVSSQERGLASSINSVIWRLPNSVTTIFGGLILASGNFSLPFLLATAFYLVSILLFYSNFKNVKVEGKTSDRLSK